jgi:hypothetical protein
MKNSTLLFILLAAGITYGQIHVEYDAETDQIITSVIAEDDIQAETFEPFQTPESNDINEFEYIFIHDNFIYKQEYMFNDYGKELFYSKLIRISRWHSSYQNKQ